MITVELVDAAWSDIRAKIKGAVLRISVNCAAKVAAISDARGVRTVLGAECQSILTELSNQFRAAA